MSVGPNVTIKFDDAEFLCRPHRWPHGNWCPVIRREAAGFNVDFSRGIVFSQDPLVVRALCRHNGWGVQEYLSADTKSYTSVQEMVADGWEVD